MGGRELQISSLADVGKRVELIETLIDLLMAEEVDYTDLEDCLDDWMT